MRRTVTTALRSTRMLDDTLRYDRRALTKRSHELVVRQCADLINGFLTTAVEQRYDVGSRP